MPQTVQREEPLKLQFASFLDCIATRNRPVVDGEAAQRALELAAIIQSGIEEHGKIVATSLAAASIKK
jgi:predicted dehydrogenase